MPTRCGHGHNWTTASFVASNLIASERSSISVVVMAAIPQSVKLGLTHRIDLSGISPGNHADPHDRSLPVRI
jgi:hypothetical protein